jgi:hypothetical protein
VGVARDFGVPSGNIASRYGKRISVREDLVARKAKTETRSTNIVRA